MKDKTIVMQMDGEDKLRFKIKQGDIEVELEGQHEYVKDKFESILQDLTSRLKSGVKTDEAKSAVTLNLEGVIETMSNGKPYLTIPVNTLTSKEAVALFLYAMKPNRLSDKALSEILTSGWKTIRAEAVRARASELRREGKLVSEKGEYGLSGAGVQWVEREVLKKVKHLQEKNE